MKKALPVMLMLLFACPAWGALGIECSEGTADTGTTFEVPQPACLEDNDLLIILIGKDDDDAISSNNGLTQAVQIAATADQVQNLSVWYKYVTSAAGEPDPYQFTQDNERGVSCAWVISGADATTPFDGVTPSEIDVAGDTSPATTGVTTKTNNAWVFSAIVTDEENPDYTIPTSMDALRAPGGQHDSAFPGGATCVITKVAQASLGATGDKEWSGIGTGFDTAGTVFVIRTSGETPPGGARRRMTITMGAE